MKMAKHATLAFAACALLGTMTFQANAAEFEVKMLNKGEKGMMVFEPDLVRAAPGDTIKFIPTDKGHNAQTIDGMIPDGAQPFQSDMGKELTVTLDKEGIYGVRCKPHFGLGMVMMIEVGKPVNEDQAKALKLPKKAKDKMDQLFTEIDAK